VEREVDPSIGPGRRSPVAPAVGTEVAEEVGTELIGPLAESGLGDERQCATLYCGGHGDERRTGSRVAPVVPRGGGSAQILGGDEGGVPSVVQQIGEGSPEPGVPLTWR